MPGPGPNPTSSSSARCCGGDEDAFERFFNVAYPAMYRFALARLDFDRDLAGEIAQAAVCKAIRNLPKLSRRGRAAHLGVHDLPQRAVRARKTARPQAPGCAGRRRPGSARRARIAACVEHRDDLDAALDRKHVASLVRRVLDSLPPHYADALEWKYIDEVTVQGDSRAAWSRRKSRRIAADARAEGVPRRVRDDDVERVP